MFEIKVKEKNMFPQFNKIFHRCISLCHKTYELNNNISLYKICIIRDDTYANDLQQ